MDLNQISRIFGPGEGSFCNVNELKVINCCDEMRLDPEYVEMVLAVAEQIRFNCNWSVGGSSTRIGARWCESTSWAYGARDQDL